MQVLGYTFLAVGITAAMIAELVALVGTFRGRWELSDFQRRNYFQRWFFSALALIVIGAALLASA